MSQNRELLVLILLIVLYCQGFLLLMDCLQGINYTPGPERDAREGMFLVLFSDEKMLTMPCSCLFLFRGQCVIHCM